jgi:DNA-binding IclR family transcriptional regulator
VTSHTITDTAELYSQLVEMRKTDISYEKEESSVGIQCKATPIRFRGKIIAAVSISFPIWVTQKDEVERIIASLCYERSQIEKIVEQNPNRWVFSSLR